MTLCGVCETMRSMDSAQENTYAPPKFKYRHRLSFISVVKLGLGQQQGKSDAFSVLQISQNN